MAGVHLKMGLLQCSTLYLSLFFLKLAQNASWRSRDISCNLLSVLASRTPALPAGTTLASGLGHRGEQRRREGVPTAGPRAGEPTMCPDEGREQRGSGGPGASRFPCSCATAPCDPAASPSSGERPRPQPHSGGGAGIRSLVL